MNFGGVLRQIIFSPVPIMEEDDAKSSDAIPDVVEAHSTSSVNHRARVLPSWFDNDASETSPKKPKVTHTSAQETTSTTGEPESADVGSTSADVNGDDDIATSSVNGDDGVTTNSAAVRSSRPKCRYKVSCYRQNAQHKADFSHPGDSDFDNEETDDEEEESEENKPHCQYGTACYRKNPLHKKHYQHTNPPSNVPALPKKRPRKQNTDAQTGSSSEDSYDYDDSFLNDASSDDYEPTDSSSETEFEPDDGDDDENKKRMLKEAVRFLNS